ncbi:MAG: restriction endonuclease [Candidatus Bipolaricaulia bacterium]
MTRKGRDLERLIALLEEHLGPEGIQVTSPDYIQGRESKSRREVDISLRSQIGSSEILVIIESRDRQGTEDVTWIEQLASKCRDVEADKAVAVSSTGFTSGARNIAITNNIELRTLEEVDPDEIVLWFTCNKITYFKHSANFDRISVNLPLPDSVKVELPPEVLTKVKPSFDINAPIFRRKKDGTSASFMDIWACAPREKLYSNVLPNGSKVKRLIHLDFTNEQDCFQLITTSGAVDIAYIEVYTELWIEVEKKPVTTVRVYRDDNKIVAQSAEFEFKHMGKTFALELHQYPQSGTQFVSVRTKASTSEIEQSANSKEDNIE